jgi:CheY-like chemotaxis protein
MKTILCIEDDFNSQLLLKMYFRRTSFDATVVSNGERAIELLKEKSFDCIITDWNLQGSLTSNHLVNTLYEYGSKGSIPIVIMTADHSLTLREIENPEKVAKILYKPILKAALIQEVTQLSEDLTKSASY